MARIDRANAEQESYSLDDWFTTFGTGLSPSQPGRHALVMLTSYMDDSGSERKGPVFVLAGYISVPEIWEQTFSPAWAECLAKPPALEYFKMAEAHRLHDAFRGWSAAQRDERLANLTRVVGQQRIMTAQVFALVWDDFQRALDDYPHVKGAYPYDALFHGVLAHTTQRLVDHKLAHQVDFVFDEQGSAGQRAILTYHAIKSVLRPELTSLIIGSPRLADDKVVLPLQAADLLAWHIRRYWAENGSFPIETDGNGEWRVKPVPEYQILDQLLQQHETVWKVYDYAAIERIFKVWPKSPGGEYVLQQIS